MTKVTLTTKKNIKSKKLPLKSSLKKKTKKFQSKRNLKSRSSVKKRRSKKDLTLKMPGISRKLKDGNPRRNLKLKKVQKSRSKN